MLRYLKMFTIYLPRNLMVLFKKITNLKLKNTLKIKRNTNKENTINIVSSYIPEQKTDGSAAVDLIAKLGTPFLLFRAGDTHLVPTGVKLEIPKGKCGLLLIRSGLSIKSPLGLANGVGLIDSDYRGEILVPLRNFSPSKRHTLNDGERIAQLLIIDHFTPIFTRVKNLEDTNRNTGGFGSTGTK